MLYKKSCALALALAFPLALGVHFARAGESAASEARFDRLDGTGASGERVNVIEWQGNLEIHIYPKGSTAGLGMKIDNRNHRKVMVIAYRFVNDPQKVLVRRAILSIPLTSNFKVYKDPTEPDFDKFIVSNNGLAGQLLAYKLDPAPTRLYPEGYKRALAESQGDTGRAPASVEDSGSGNSGSGSYRQTTTNGPGPGGVDSAGSISFQRDFGGPRGHH